jgi:hypothetical protein
MIRARPPTRCCAPRCRGGCSRGHLSWRAGACRSPRSLVPTLINHPLKCCHGSAASWRRGSLSAAEGWRTYAQPPLLGSPTRPAALPRWARGRGLVASEKVREGLCSSGTGPKAFPSTCGVREQFEPKQHIAAWIQRRLWVGLARDLSTHEFDAMNNNLSRHCFQVIN